MENWEKFESEDFITLEIVNNKFNDRQKLIFGLVSILPPTIFLAIWSHFDINQMENDGILDISSIIELCKIVDEKTTHLDNTVLHTISAVIAEELKR
jgi:hypothetical protein